MSHSPVHGLSHSPVHGLSYPPVHGLSQITTLVNGKVRHDLGLVWIARHIHHHGIHTTSKHGNGAIHRIHSHSTCSHKESREVDMCEGGMCEGGMCEGGVCEGGVHV